MIFEIRRESDLELLKKSLAAPHITQPWKVGVTTGTFDMFHEMHRTYLQRCRRRCNFLIVGVDSDDLVRETKGPDRPIVPEHQRVSLVASMSAVGAAFTLDSLQDLRTLVDLGSVNLIFRNQEWKGREKEVVGSDKAEVVIISDSVQVNSTSQLIEEVIRRKTAK